MNRSLFLVLFVLLLTPVFLARGEDEPKVETEVAVHVARVVRTTLHRYVTAYGTVEPEPPSAGKPPASARLSPATAGIITEVSGEEGQQVEKGTILFRLDSRAADSAVAKAEAAVEFAQKNADRQKKLIAAEGTSEKLLLESEQALGAARTELAAAKVQQSLLRGEAPLSGTLVRFTARPGEAADVGTVLAEIVDLDRLVATVRVPRAEIPDVKTGQNARIRVDKRESDLSAAVAYVGRLIEPATDTAAVRLSIGKGNGLLPGQFVTAQLAVEERAGCLAVPRASVFTNPDGESTLSLVEGGVATRKTVKLGMADGDLVEVEGEGVTEGATVVTVGSYGLPEKTKVRIIKDEPGKNGAAASPPLQLELLLGLPNLERCDSIGLALVNVRRCVGLQDSRQVTAR